MDINLGGDNSISNLSFYWRAILKDGKKINQIEGKLFKEVRDNFSNLAYFILYHKEKDIKFTVDIAQGLIYFGSPKILESDNRLIKKRENVRIIHKRIQREFVSTQNFQTIEMKVNYLLGLQYNDEEGKNRKILMQIDENGDFIIGD